MAKYKVYVAGSSMEPNRVERVVERLEATGKVEVVGKWTPQTRRHGSQGAELPREVRWKEAAGIRDVLLTVDGFLFLTPRSPATTKGGFWECGFVEGLDAARAVCGVLAPRVASVVACDEGVLPEFILDVPRYWHHEITDVEACAKLLALLDARYAKQHQIANVLGRGVIVVYRRDPDDAEHRWLVHLEEDPTFHSFGATQREALIAGRELAVLFAVERGGDGSGWPEDWVVTHDWPDGEDLDPELAREFGLRPQPQEE